VVPGAGTALIANNVIAEVRSGAIIGMARSKVVTGDLAKGCAEQYAHLSVSGNRLRLDRHQTLPFLHVLHAPR
jgi:hypothetical protein